MLPGCRESCFKRPFCRPVSPALFQRVIGVKPDLRADFPIAQEKTSMHRQGFGVGVAQGTAGCHQGHAVVMALAKSAGCRPNRVREDVVKLISYWRKLTISVARRRFAQERAG